MCPWVGPHAPSFGRQLWGLPSPVAYLSPQGVLLPLVYGTTTSPLWLELRDLSAWQATPPRTVYRLACQRLLPWLRVTFAMVPDAAWPGTDQRPWGTAPAAGPVGRLGPPSASDPWGVGSFLSLGRPTCACVCGVLGHLAPVHRCARLVRCFACAVSWATWLLFTGVPARCVALLVWCPGPLGSCSPLCPLGALLCGCGVPGPLAPVHRYARSVCCFACAVSWTNWLLLTGVPARCVVLRVRCPGPLGSSSLMCPRGLLCCVCGVLGHLAPVHGCAASVCCFACAVSWATWLLFTGVPARCVDLRVRCPGPLGSRSPVCPRGLLCWVCGVLGHLAPVHRCARLVRCFACAVSWATWLLFSCVPLGLLCWVCGVLGPLAPVHRCSRSMCCVGCAVSWATWLLFTGAPARCAVLGVRCPWPLGSCSPVCPLGVLCCVCGVLGPLAPVHRCASPVCCVACAVSWATWLLLPGAPARFVVLCVRCPGPLGSCSPLGPLSVFCCVCGVLGPLAPSPVCPLGVLCCVCGVLGHLAPVHRCARLVCCVACAVFLAPWLLFTGGPARCVLLRARCPGPLGSCSPVRPLGLWCCVYGVLGHLAPVHRCARSVCCVARTVSRPLGSCSPVRPLGLWCCVYGVLAHLAPVHRCARSVCCVACTVSRPLGSCSPVRPLGVLCCVCGVLGHSAPVHRCARSVCCVACAVFWAPWLLFTGGPARCVLLRARCPRPLGSCSPVRPLDVLCWVCGVLGPLAPVHRCARSVCCVACVVSWAPWLLFTGVPARCVVLRVRCPGPLGSCSLVRPLGLSCCVYGVLGPLAPVHRWARSVCSVVCAVSWAPWLLHRCARSVCCVACAVSWATWLLFTGVPAWCAVLHVRCSWPLGCCSPVGPLGVFCCVRGALGHLAPVHRCARSVCGAACTVSWATWLLFTGVPALCVVLHVRCPGHLAPVHRCARSVCGAACMVSWPTWLLFTGVPALCVVLRVRCPGHLAPVHQCARSVCCVACAVSWATRLLFTGVPARCAVLHVRCSGPLGSCSPVGPLGVFCCVRGVLGHLAPVHRCARSVCGAGCPVSWATWLLFTGVRALCVVLRVRCPGHLAPVHRCACSVCCAVCCVCGGALRGAHSSIRTAAGVAWHLFSCRGSLRVVRALRVCSTRRPLLLGTCPCALVVAGGVPLWRASWPRLVRCTLSGPVAVGAPVGFPDAVVPFPTPGACAPGVTGWLRGARGGRPGTGLIVPAAGPCRGRGAGLAPRRSHSGPRDGVVPGGSLLRRSWAAYAAVVHVCGPSH